MPKQFLVIEICRTAKAWTRVYKNIPAYNKGKMLFETSSTTKTASDRQLARRTLKTMADIGGLIGYEGSRERNQRVWVIDEEDRQKFMRIFV